MWPIKPKPKTRDPGFRYEVGDKVKIWTVFKHPFGRVLDVIVDDQGHVKEYTVSYEYHDGTYHSDEFKGTDLTLAERTSKKDCNCGSNSRKHLTWCNKIVHPQGW